jgi:hypothetical protein
MTADTLSTVLELASLGRVDEARAAAARLDDERDREAAAWVLEGLASRVSARPQAPPHVDAGAAPDREKGAMVDEGLEDLEGDDAVDLPPPLGARPTDAVVSSFLAWFGGRRDLYARQWLDERRGRAGYSPVHEPLTAVVAARHLAGHVTVGQYLLFPDGTVSFGVIDLDLDASALAELKSTRGDEVSALAHPGLASYTRRLVDAAARVGLPLFAEDSGGKGAHLWLFVRPRRPARHVRAVLGQIVRGAGPEPAEVSVEIFPKQEQAGPRGLSSLVKLPLGVHRGTLRPAPLLDEHLRPIDDPLAALERLEACDEAVLDAVAGRRLALLPSAELAAVEPATRRVEAPRSTPASLAEALRAIAPESEREASTRVLSRCAPLRALVDRAFRDRRLGPDEARAIAYTLGLVSRTPTLARDVLVAAGCSTKELERLGRGLPSPLGCKRLKDIAAADERAPCEGCHDRALPYPTPTLHALDGPLRERRLGPDLDGDPLAALVESPLDTLGRTLARIEARLEELELERRAPKEADASLAQEPSSTITNGPAREASAPDAEPKPTNAGDALTSGASREGPLGARDRP